MQTVHILSKTEVEQVTFTVRLIADRTYSKLSDQEANDAGVWCGLRTDMYWVRPMLEGKDLGEVCICPNWDDNDFDISQNYCRVQKPERLFKRIREWFIQQPEYQQQLQWVSYIRERLTRIGGLKAHQEHWRALEAAWLDRKIAAAKKYSAEIETFITTKGSNGDALQALLVVEPGVYLHNALQYAGLEHIVWVWKTYVKGK